MPEQKRAAGGCGGKGDDWRRAGRVDTGEGSAPSILEPSGAFLKAVEYAVDEVRAGRLADMAAIHYAKAVEWQDSTRRCHSRR